MPKQYYFVMVSNYNTRGIVRFFKIVIFTFILGATSAHALEKSNFQSSIDADDTVSQRQRSSKQPLSTSASCTAYFKETVNANNCRAGEVPLPAARWLLLLALIGFVGLSNKRKI